MPKDRWRKATDRKLAPGIYNYCDRWCERCPATQLCFVYQSEQKRRKEHLREGRNPEDWDVVMQDCRRNFEEALAMLEEMAQEQGIDPNLPDEAEVAKAEAIIEGIEEEEEHHPLVVEAGCYTHAAAEFLQSLRQTLETEASEAMELVEILPEEGLLSRLETLRDSYEVIEWYHIFISVKIRRAIRGISHLVRELFPHGDPRPGDAIGSAKVASEALMKSMAAYKKVYDLLPGLRNEILDLLVKAKRLSTKIDRLFPEHREFFRPGLDGPYVPEEEEDTEEMEAND